MFLDEEANRVTKTIDFPAASRATRDIFSRQSHHEFMHTHPPLTIFVYHQLTSRELFHARPLPTASNKRSSKCPICERQTSSSMRHAYGNILACQRINLTALYLEMVQGLNTRKFHLMLALNKPDHEHMPQFESLGKDSILQCRANTLWNVLLRQQK